MSKSITTIRPIHPFPARMAPSIALRRLSGRKGTLRVLDPMVGSGTTAVAARLRGHRAIGFDTDPLALLIAKTWASDIKPKHLRKSAEKVLKEAEKIYKKLHVKDAYPVGADKETKAFIRFWFDATNRRQLAALAGSISKIKESVDRTLLWCAFSRLIITKQSGASLAMDVSHSRPHKVYERAPRKPLNDFENAVRRILRACPFSAHTKNSEASVSMGDARRLPLPDCNVDLVVTSPPYLNAIDYLRGHKFSLVWMGHTVGRIREIRSSNVGSEAGVKPNHTD